MVDAAWTVLPQPAFPTLYQQNGSSRLPAQPTIGPEYISRKFLRFWIRQDWHLLRTRGSPSLIHMMLEQPLRSSLFTQTLGSFILSIEIGGIYPLLKVTKSLVCCRRDE